MSEYQDDQVVEHATAAYEAIRALNHETMNRVDLTPAGVSDAVANLAAMTASLPQACAQLASLLAKSQITQVLTMDELVNETDASMAIGQAQIHLDEARELAVDLHKLLDAAHQVTAHIVSTDTRNT